MYSVAGKKTVTISGELTDEDDLAAFNSDDELLVATPPSTAPYGKVFGTGVYGLDEPPHRFIVKVRLSFAM